MVDVFEHFGIWHFVHDVDGAMAIDNKDLPRDNWVRITPTHGAPYEYDNKRAAEDAMQLCYDRTQPWLYRICEI